MPSKQWISSNTLLYLVSLFVAAIIWLIAKQGEIDTAQINVKISGVNIPHNCEVEIEPASALVEVQFPRSQETFVVSRNFNIEVDLSTVDTWAGVDDFSVISYPLSSESVKALNVPETVTPRSITSPKSIVIRAKLFTTKAKVKAQIIGEPSQGFHLAKAPVTHPEIVIVTGPTALLEMLKDQDGTAIVSTEPISVEGRKSGYFQTATISLPLPRTELGKLKLVNENQKEVEVNVYIEEDVDLKTFTGVPVAIRTITEGLVVDVEPSTTSVTVEAPVSVLNQIDPLTAFVFSPLLPTREEPGLTSKIAIEAVFSPSVSPEIRQQARIKKLDPDVVIITYSANEK